MMIRQDIKKAITVMSLGVLLTGCASTMASIKTVPATLGYVTAVHKDLISLPPVQIFYISSPDISPCSNCSNLFLSSE